MVRILSLFFAVFLTVRPIGAAWAESAVHVASIETLPLSVKSLYLKLCPNEYWIDNKRVLDGSTTDTFPDGTKVFLMVCGDAGSTVPFAVISMALSGEAKETPFKWSLRGKTVESSGLSNAHFGTQAATVVTSSHLSATCEPTYTSQWDGTSFQLLALNRKGCRRGE